MASGALEAGPLQEVEAHLADCQDCREELGLLRAIWNARPEPPAELEARIRARVREEFGSETAPASIHAPKRKGGRGGLVIPLFGRRYPLPTSALPAAAVIILALGVAVIWQPGPPEVSQDPVQVVLAEEPLPESFLWDDGMVAGAPVFDGLSDEDLEILLAELEEGGA
jgi:hypothetical protein